MRTDELYAYWDEVHADLLEVIGFLSEEQADICPHDGAKSIRDLVLDFVYMERVHAQSLAGGFAYERPSAQLHPDGASLVDLVRATREVTDRVLEPLTVAGLRAVRTLPGDPGLNQQETNVTIAWLFWRVMQREIECLAQVNLRLADVRAKKPGRWG